MLTLILQLCNSVLYLALGGVALAVGRRGEPARERRAAAWLLLGITFLLMGSVRALQNLWGTWAFVLGPDNPVYQTYLLWAPSMNHSRGVVVIAFGALLTLIALGGCDGRRFWRLVPGGLGLGALLGAGIGWLEGSLQGGVHYSVVAMLASVELIVLLGALLAGLATAALDRLLWLSLAVYALGEALNAIWFSALAWVDVADTWTPSPSQVQLYHMAIYVLMLVLASRRRSLALADQPVPALVEPRAAPRILG